MRAETYIHDTGTFRCRTIAIPIDNATNGNIKRLNLRGCVIRNTHSIPSLCRRIGQLIRLRIRAYVQQNYSFWSCYAANNSTTYFRSGYPGRCHCYPTKHLDVNCRTRSRCRVKFCLATCTQNTTSKFYILWMTTTMCADHDTAL